MIKRLLVPGLVVGALLRVVALPLPGTGDLTVFKLWSFAAAHDITGMYGVGGSPPERRLLHWQDQATTVDYPPMALYEVAVAGRAYELIHPLMEDSRMFNVFVKLPGIAAEVSLVIVVLTWGRRRYGDDAAAWTALAVWLNPMAILDGAVLGYTDAEMAVPAVLALVAAIADVEWLAGVLAAIAVLTKPQAIFILPVVIVVIARRGRKSIAWAAIGGGVTSALLLAPFVVRGAWTNMVQALGRVATHDMLSGNAANVWWIFTWALRVIDVHGEWGWWRALTQEVRILAITRAVDLGYPNARVVGLMIVGTLIGRAAWRVRHISSLAGAAALAGWSAYAYAMFAAQVHENHLYLAVPFLAIAAGLDRRYRRVFWSVATIAALNLYLFYGFGADWPPISRSVTVIDATVVLSVVNVIVFAWCTLQVFVGTSRQNPPASPLAMAA